MLRHATYKRNEKDFATKVVEDDATGLVTLYVDDKAAVTSETNPVTGVVEISGADELNLTSAMSKNGFSSIFKFLTAGQIADVLARTFTLDLSAAIQAAVNTGSALYFPAGGYRMDSEVVLLPSVPNTLFTDNGQAEIRAGATMEQFFRKPDFANGGTIEPVFICGFKFSCQRLVDRAFWIPVSKKGAVTNVTVNNFIVEAWKGGDDTGSYTARFYENHISHNIIDGGVNNAGAVETMPLYGINLTENATDNIIIGPEVGYVSEAGLRAVGGGNRSFGCHTYGLNSADTGPKYNIIAGAFGIHDAVYADNVTVAGVKITGDSVSIGAMFAYWAVDNTPSVAGAVPVEVNSGIGPLNIDSIMIRGGHSSNPAVRFLGAFWGREWRIGGVVGAHTPQATTPAATGASVIPRSIRVIGQNGVESDIGVEAQTAAIKTGYKWYVNSLLRYQCMTNASGETGGNAGSNLQFGSYADNGTTYSNAWTHYRASNQFDYAAKVRFIGDVGIGNISVGSGQGVFCIGNAAVAPTTNPIGGGILYAEGGAIKWRGSSGTVTTLAPA